MEIVNRIGKNKKLVGKVTSEEKEEIKRLFERKNGLAELFKSLNDIDSNDGNKLYEKIVTDMGKVATDFQNWWTLKSTKYNWESIKDYSWEIDFETCEIFLVKKK
jgi:CXXX repeat modification system protein